MTEHSDVRHSARHEVFDTASGQRHVAGTQSVNGVHGHRTGQPLPVPFQIPPSPRTFAGRRVELDELSSLLGSGPGRITIVLNGIAGVGKTTLALHWLPSLNDTFVDGLLFADLDRSASDSATTGDVLEGFLLALGVKAEDVPDDTTHRQALYRSLTAGRRLAVLLDNASSPTQVHSLLPGGNTSIAVITSEHRLSDLALGAAQSFQVEPLDAAASLELLTQMLGAHRVRAEPDAAHELVMLCGGLPLALSIVGARLTARAHRILADEVTSLRGDRRLARMAIGDASVAALFDVWYADLPEDAASLYRACCWHPGPDVEIPAAAAAVGWDAVRAEDALYELVEANFLTEVADGRFRYHTLLRDHAQDHALRFDSPGVRDSALRGMIEWYLGEAVVADRVIHPHRPRLGQRYGARSETRYADERAALAWCEARRVHLRSAIAVAAQHGWHALVWQLCEAMWGFFLHTRHYEDWIRIHQTAIASAQAISDPSAEARMRSQLAFAYTKLGRVDEASAENTMAYQLAEAAQDRQGMATAISQFGRIARDIGDLHTALRHYRRARDLQEEIGEVRGVALCRRRIGQVLSRLGEHAEAAVEFAAAAQTMRDLADTTQYARTVMALADSHVQMSQLDEAAQLLRDALTLMRDFGSAYYQAEMWARLAEVAVGQGDRTAAIDHYRHAVALYDAVEDPLAEDLRARLAELDQTGAS